MTIIRCCTTLYNFLYDIEVPHRPKRKKLVFAKNRFVIKFVTNFAILMTFGVMFPLLAIIACVSVVTEIADLQVVLSEYFDMDNRLVSTRKAVNEESAENIKVDSPTSGEGVEMGEKIVGDVVSISTATGDASPLPSETDAFPHEETKEHNKDAEKWRLQEYDVNCADGEEDNEDDESREDDEEEKEERSIHRDMSAFSTGSAGSTKQGLEHYTKSSFKRGIDLSNYTYNQRNAEYKLYQVEQKFNKVSYIMSHLLWLLFPLSAVFYAAFLFDMMGDARGFEDAVRVSVLMFGVPCVAMLIYELNRNYVVRSTFNTYEMGERSGSSRSSFSEQFSIRSTNIFKTDGSFKGSIRGGSMRCAIVVPPPEIADEPDVEEGFESPTDRTSLSRKVGAPDVLVVDIRGDGFNESEHSNRSRSNSKASPQGGEPSPSRLRTNSKSSPRRGYIGESGESSRLRTDSSIKAPRGSISGHYSSSQFSPNSTIRKSQKNGDFPMMDRFDSGRNELMRAESTYIKQMMLEDEDEGVDEDERRAKRKSSRVEKVEETAGDFIQQALSLLLK
eukprot:gene28751-35667_t